MLCFKSLRYTEEEYFYKKARLRLTQEMDIKRFVRKIRQDRNSMKFLTTLPERRLVQMQADKNVLTMRELDYEALEDSPHEMTTKEINRLCGDESAFSSEEYEPYIT